MEAFVPLVPKVYKSSLEVLAAAKEDSVDHHGVPSVQEASHSHFKSEDKDDSLFTSGITRSLSGRGHNWSLILLFYTK